MTPRQRVLEAVRHGRPDVCPKEAGFTPAVFDEFQRRTGRSDPGVYFGMETLAVGFRPPPTIPDRSRWEAKLPAEAELSSDVYGIYTVPAGFYHFTGYVHPLADVRESAEIDAYPFGDIEGRECHEHLEAEVAERHEQGFFVDGFAGHIFENAWQIIGMETMFERMATDAGLVDRLFRRIGAHACFQARRLAEAGVDMLRTGDDVGMQTGLMMRPDRWRELLKPRLRDVIVAAREVQPDIPVWYHSDGDIREIIDDLIEVGVTVLNPVQPECLPVEELAARYGGTLAFWGTIGTQSVMPFGTPQEVEDNVRRMVDLFGPALVLAPTHVLEPDVPWENVVAFFEAIEKWGRYA